MCSINDGLKASATAGRGSKLLLVSLTLLTGPLRLSVFSFDLVLFLLSVQNRFPGRLHVGSMGLLYAAPIDFISA